MEEKGEMWFIEACDDDLSGWMDVMLGGHEVIA